MSTYQKLQDDAKKTMSEIAGRYGGKFGSQLYAAMKVHLKPYFNDFYNIGLDEGYRHGEVDAYDDIEVSK